MTVLQEHLGVSRRTMWIGLGIFHAVLGTRFLVADDGAVQMTTAVLLFTVAGGMLGWGVCQSRKG